MKKFLFLLSVCLTLAFSSSATPRETENLSADIAQNANAVSDAPSFDAKGPVKSINVNDGNYKYSFSQQGRLTVIQNLKVGTEVKVKRDAQGRIIQTDEGDYVATFAYDANGLLKRYTLKSDYDDTVEEYVRDQNGEIVKRIATIGGFKSIYVCKVTARDKYGNWTQREETEQEYGEKEVTTRVITYWQ